MGPTFTSLYPFGPLALSPKSALVMPRRLPPVNAHAREQNLRVRFPTTITSGFSQVRQFKTSLGFLLAITLHSVQQYPCVAVPGTNSVPQVLHVLSGSMRFPGSLYQHAEEQYFPVVFPFSMKLVPQTTQFFFPFLQATEQKIRRGLLGVNSIPHAAQVFDLSWRQ